jgi:HEAT repeat protein
MILALCLGVAVLSPAAAADSAEKLMRQLNSSNAGKRAEAAWDLGQMGAVEAVPALTQALSDEARSVRSNAAASLWRLGEASRPAMPALQAALDDPHGGVVANVVGALRKLGVSAEELEPAYQRLMGEADCGWALRGVRGLKSYTDPRELFPRTLACAYEADDSDDRRDADKLLREFMEDRSVIPQVVAALEQSRERSSSTLLIGVAKLKPVAEEAIAAVANQLGSSIAQNRADAALALGWMKAQQALSELQSALASDPEPDVRTRAADAIGDIGPDAVAAVPALIAAVENDEWPEVQQAAMGALGEMREHAKDAIPVLYRKLEDANSFTRIAARNALFRVDPENKEKVVAIEDARAATPPAGGASTRLFEDVRGLADALEARAPVIADLVLYEDFAMANAPQSGGGWVNFTYRNGEVTGPADGNVSCNKTLKLADLDLDMGPKLVDQAMKQAGPGAEVSLVKLGPDVFCKKQLWTVYFKPGAAASRIEYDLKGKQVKVWP